MKRKCLITQRKGNLGVWFSNGGLQPVTSEWDDESPLSEDALGANLKTEGCREGGYG